MLDMLQYMLLYRTVVLCWSMYSSMQMIILLQQVIIVCAQGEKYHQVGL